MFDKKITGRYAFNLAEFHMEQVKNSLECVEKYESRSMKIKEMMETSNKAERAIMQLKELQSELAKQIENI